MTTNRFVLCLVAVLLASPAAASSTYTWSGNGATAFWSDAANWSTGVVPPQLNDLVIGTGFNSGTNILLTRNEVPWSLRFKNAPNGLRLSHGFGGPWTIYLWTSLVRESTCSGEQRILEPIDLNTQGTWTINGTGKLRIDSTISSQPGVGMVKNGDGELALYGAGTWQGNTTVNNGLVTLAHANALPANKALFVNGANTRVNLTTSLASAQTQIQVNNGAKLTANAGVSLTAPFVILSGTSELGAQITGSAGVYLASQANAVISTGQSYNGPLTLNSNSTLNAPVGAGALGLSTNALVMHDGARALFPTNTTLSSTRTLTTSGATATLRGVYALNSALQGPATLLLETTVTTVTVTLGGNSPGFTGSIVRTTGNLTATTAGSFGNATEIRVNDVGSKLKVATDNVTSGGGRPDIELGSQGTLDLDGHSASLGTVGAIGAGTSNFTIALAPNTVPPLTPTTLTLEGIDLGPTTCTPPAARVVIKGWIGQPGFLPVHRHIIIDGPLPSDDALACIQFEGQPLLGARMIGNELVADNI